MPHVFGEAAGEPEFVMIKDEHGVERSWPVIHRPKRIPKNPNLRKLMDLGEDDPDDDSADESETQDAQKSILRSVRKCTRLAMNAVIPGVSRGELYWSQITSGERAAVHNEVVELNPYLKRFPGGWITEIFMKRHLRTTRDTRERNKKKKEGKAGALSLLSKQQRTSSSTKAIRSPKAPARATNASNPSQGPSNAATSKKKTSNKDKGPVPEPQPQVEAATNHSNADANTQAADAPEPQAPTPRSESDTGKRRADAPEPDAPAPPSKKPKTLFSYFQPVKAQSSAPANNLKDGGAKGADKGDKTHGGTALGAELGCDSAEEDWRDEATRQVAESGTQKRGKDNAKESGTRRRPKMRVPRSKSDEDSSDEDIFRRTTRAAKQEYIDESEGVAGPSKSKQAPNSKKSKGKGKAKK